MTPEERKGIEELLDSDFITNPTTLAWLKHQLEANDWDNSIERMGGGKKARNAYMNPIFDTRCSVTAFDQHAQLMADGRERGLWVWLHDESKARAGTYDKWADDALQLFCQLTGVDDKSMAKFRLSTSMDEFKRMAKAKTDEAALLEWPAVKKMYEVIGEQLRKHGKLPKPGDGRASKPKAKRKRSR